VFAITGGKGFHITMPNGWTVSAQFGPANYCENRSYDEDAVHLVPCPNQWRVYECRDAEVAVFRADTGAWLWPEQVRGHQSVADVLRVLAEVAAL